MSVTRLRGRIVPAFALLLAIAATLYVSSNAAKGPSPHPLRLRTGDRFLTAADAETFLKSAAGPRGGVVQFEALPTPSQRESLRALGVQLQRYLPDNAFIASIPAGVSMAQLERAGVQWVGGLRPEDKIAEALAVYGITPEWAVGADGLPRFTVGLYPHVELAQAVDWLAADYGAQVSGVSRLGHAVEVALPADNWADIAADARVVWLEPFWPRVPHNNSNRTNVTADVAQSVPYNLNGLGIVVGEWDEGRADPNHADFGGRIISADASAISTHSTHVAGTVLGGGASPDFTYKGMAPMAIMLSHQWWNSGSEMEIEYQNGIDNVDMRIATNSWGVGYSPPNVPNCNAFLGNYFAECGNLDDVARGDLGQPVTIVWSAGNERLGSSQYCGSAGFTWGTVTPYGTAKNVLTIGAINSNNSTMTSFSSWGPTDDGRLKPELVAPGCQTTVDFGVTSTKPGSGYTVACGTSMSAPTVSGCVALWMQRWMASRPNPPFASTVKAVFVESADDLGDPGPEYDWGYGRVDVTAAVDLLDQNRYLEDSIVQGETKTWTFTNSGALSLISVTLAWDDPAAAANAATTLINNLNLRLIPPSGPAEHLPWVLNPADPSANATAGVNIRDNLEQVRLTGALATGTWIVEVTGASVPQGPQRFSLAFAPGMTLSSTQQAYNLDIEPVTNPASFAGVAALPFTLANMGFTADTYDVTLSSSHGWAIADNPRVIALGGYSDSALTYSLTIPGGTPYGTIDTIVALAESQGAPPLSSIDTMFVTVISGRAVWTEAGRDSLGVVGRTVQMTARLTNAGIADDTLSWTVGIALGWSVSPAAGSVAVAQGEFADIAFDVTIPPSVPYGTTAQIVIAGVSTDDPSAADADTMTLQALPRPPHPILLDPADATLSAQNIQTLRWTHDSYTAPPPGFADFDYYVDLADDPAFTVNAVRTGLFADTQTVTAALPDGTHYWRVLTVNPLGDTSDLSAPRQFTTDTQAPAVPTLDQPADSLYEADTTVTFTWQSVLDAAQYKWEMAPDPSFTVAVDSALLVAAAQERTLPSCSTVVYWRVTAIDAVGNRSAPSPAHRYAVYQIGDINFDCQLSILDVVGIVEIAFRGGAFPDPEGRAELLCNPPVDITDVARLIDIVFRGGVPPCGPN